MGFLAAGHEGAPYIQVYDADTLVNAAGFSAAALTTEVRHVAFSPTGEFMAVSQSVDPYLVVYRTTDWVIVFSDTLPGFIGGVGFTSDSARLIVTHSASPFCSVYTTASWTPAAAPTLAQAARVSVDPKGGLVAFTGNATPTVLVFSDTTWVLESGYTVTGLVQTTCAAFNPVQDELVLVYSDASDTRIIVMDTTDGSEAVASVAVTGAANVAVDATGVYAAVTRFDSPYLSVFDASSLSTVPVVAPPAGTTRAVAFDGSGATLTVGSDDSPRISMYSVPAFTLLTPPASEPPARVWNIAYGGDFVPPVTTFFWTNRVRTQEVI